MVDAVYLVGAVLRELSPAALHKAKVSRAIKSKSRVDEPGWDLPKGMSADQFLDHLIHQGVMQPDRDCEHRLICPIPRLRTWLIEQIQCRSVGKFRTGSAAVGTGSTGRS